MSALKQLTYHGKNYFIDAKLQELRAVNNPHESMSFEEYCALKDTNVHGYPTGLSGCGTCPLNKFCTL